jgi:hypothetical protein
VKDDALVVEPAPAKALAADDTLEVA